MIKLYKYRPLTDFLFKELYYSELYFASYSELNDPLDLSVRIDFRPENEREIISLIVFLVKVSLLYEDEINDNNQRIIDFVNNKELTREFCGQLYDSVIKLNRDFLPYEVIENHIAALSKEYNIQFKISELDNEIQSLAKVFFENSYTTCFSEIPSDFLMWSHYASKHSGICLEFSSAHEERFPYIFRSKRRPDKEKYLENSSQWDSKEHIYWDRIRKIKYQDKPPSINFYEFLPVFENKNDIDLIKLSKSKCHGFAHELERVFSIKTTPWEYEKEWRAIEINFDKIKEPEERIRHYPIEILTGIYFGIRTPEPVKVRIYSLFKSKNADVKYFDAQLTNERDLSFNEWEYHEE